jgi:hypothetical protein
MAISVDHIVHRRTQAAIPGIGEDADLAGHKRMLAPHLPFVKPATNVVGHLPETTSMKVLQVLDGFARTKQDDKASDRSGG